MAIGRNARTTQVGYNIDEADQVRTGQSLPMMIAVFGEANWSNQTGLSTNKMRITSANQAGTEYGFGSPIHQSIRMLMPETGGGVEAIPVYVFPQVSDGSATAAVRTITVAGTANANATHSVSINGRQNINSDTYEYSVESGNTATQIATKIAAAINAVTSSPVTATSASGVVTITTKWRGLTSNEILANVDNRGTAAGLSYAGAQTVTAVGAVTLTPSLNQFGSDWFTHILNPYGSTHFTTFNNFNGRPGVTNPTGRYEEQVFLPTMVFWGSRSSTIAGVTNLTTTQRDEATNVSVPAGNSQSATWEIAAAALLKNTVQADQSPEQPIEGATLNDIHVPTDNNPGEWGTLANRELALSRGSSTTTIENGKYVIKDLVTTNHPVALGNDPEFAQVRDLIIDWNISFRYRALERAEVVGRVIIADNVITSSNNTVSPSSWKGEVQTLFEDLESDALIADPDFSRASLTVVVDPNNRNRLNTDFKYKRTGSAKVLSTNVQVSR